MFNYLKGFDPSQKGFMIDLKSNLAYFDPCQHWSHHIIKKSKEVTGRQMLFVFTDHQRDLHTSWINWVQSKFSIPQSQSDTARDPF